MARIRIDTSNTSFRDLRENQLCYVDKTDFIEEYISSSQESLRDYTPQALWQKPDIKHAG